MEDVSSSDERETMTTATPAAIRTEGLTKHYKDVKALVDLDLEVEPGEVFGFLGPNGAGKTTTIRSLLHFIFPTGGSASILGLDVATQALEIRSHIGYMPAEYSLYPKLTGAEMVTYFGNLRGGVDKAFVGSLAERLDADLTRNIKDLSTGNKQKIGLILAFMNKPQLLILDEPSTGLDPLMQQELQSMIREVRDDGRTVFLSSHSLAEVERVADRVGILRQGNLVVVERVDALKRKAIRRIDLEFDAPVETTAFEGIAGVRSAEARGNSVSVSFEGSVNALLRAALDHDVVNVNSHEADLEQIFLDYYHGNGSDAQPPAR
jgi:ABC-2 type transport system ATP-binding protein